MVEHTVDLIIHVYTLMTLKREYNLSSATYGKIAFNHEITISVLNDVLPYRKRLT